MKNIYGFRWGAIVLLFVLWACNPAKNTAINRAYHTTTAHYNGYFNANLLLDQALTEYRNNLKEDYYSLLPLQVYPDTGAVKNMYPAIDTAIAKCTKVIQDHSMPGSARPSLKKEENNNYIDENWTTIGKASFLRRDYQAAMKNFQFIKKFYTNDPSNYVGELWMAKTNIATGNLTDAGFNLDKLDKVLETEAETKKEKDFKSFMANLKKSKKKRAEEKENEPAPFPKEILAEYYLTKAELNLARGEKEEAIINLTAATKEIRQKAKKARIYFIIAQLNEQSGDNPGAVSNYTKSIKSNAPFEMEFSARLRRAYLGGSDKLVKDLNKMLKDAKNAEFKDQIYYALANIELSKGNEPKAVEYLTASAFYSTSNARQKGMAYEKLGDLSFTKRDYIPAQKYYDSCAKVINDQYPNADAIRNKAEKLSDLVIAVETAQFEDSVQRIAAMSEEQQEAYLKDVAEKLKKKEVDRKKKEAEKLIELQKNEAAFNQNQKGNTFVFANAKARAKGFEDFKRQWGSRDNEDDWRRSEKITQTIKTVDEGGEDVVEDSVKKVVEDVKDPFSTEVLAKNIPKGDSAMNASRDRMFAALYKAGVIYKDQLNEEGLAGKQFNSVIERTYESEYKVMSAYQLYKMYEKSNKAEADIHKNYILNYYPNSDYACYLRDPDCFVKKKEFEAKTEKEYVEALNRYRQGLYYPALTRAEEVIKDEPKNEFRPKYLLLKAMCQGKLNEDKTTLIPTLTQLTDEFPDTPEAARAQEMLDIIKNGFSKNESVDFNKKSIYVFDDTAPHYVVVFLDEGANPGLSKTNISNFNKEFYSRANLKTSSKIFGDDKSVIVIDKFENDLDAKEYMRTFKATRKHLFDLQNAKTILITQENLKTLFETQKLTEYQEFSDEYY
jgi:hypothetical protein